MQSALPDSKEAQFRAEVEARIERVPFDTCWHWTGHVGKTGYGRFRNWQAHRVVYELYREQIPAGLSIDHLCRVHDCVNPDHLEPVTTRENVLRGIAPAARNFAATHCIDGHPLDADHVRYVLNRYGFYGRYCIECGVKHARNHWRRKNPDYDGLTQLNPEGNHHRHGDGHPMRKLSSDDVRAIKATPRYIGSIDDLCVKYGVSRSTIIGIRNGRLWRHLDAPVEFAPKKATTSTRSEHRG